MAQKNKEIIRKLNQGFEADDDEIILSCLADDIRWHVAGFFTVNGKEEYRKHIRDDNFEGAPSITIKNEIAEGDFVAVEGRVECKLKNGTLFQSYFHNTYQLKDGKVKAMTSYLVPITNVNLDSMKEI